MYKEDKYGKFLEHKKPYKNQFRLTECEMKYIMEVGKSEKRIAPGGGLKIGGWTRGLRCVCSLSVFMALYHQSSTFLKADTR